MKYSTTMELYTDFGSDKIMLCNGEEKGVMMMKIHKSYYAHNQDGQVSEHTETIEIGLTISDACALIEMITGLEKHVKG